MPFAKPFEPFTSLNWSATSVLLGRKLVHTDVLLVDPVLVISPGVNKTLADLPTGNSKDNPGLLNGLFNL